MPSGTILSLYIGPVVPLPAPRAAIEALESAEVTVPDRGPSVFQLQFRIPKRSPLETLFLFGTSVQPQPIIRVVLAVTVNSTPTVLIDGMVTQQQLLPGHDGRGALLSITGEDLSAVMRRFDASGFPFPASPAEARVLVMLAKYAALGVIPMVIPSVMLDVPIPTSRIPTQRGSDYEYMMQLADEVGYVFYLDPTAQPGVSVAYWGPSIRVGVPQPALTIDADARSTCDSLRFTFQSEKAELPVVIVYNEQTKMPIPLPVPPVTPLSPPLGAVPPLSLNIRKIDGGAKLSVPRALGLGLAKAASSWDVVRGEGTLDVLRYGRVLKPRALVGVRGAGLAFDGLHYVQSVTHKLGRGSFTQSFTLVRNGLISTVPRVTA